MYNTRFCFEISESAQIVKDENGNPSKAYMQFELQHEKPMNEKQYANLHKKLVNGFAEQIGVAPEYLRPISNSEYDENNDPETAETLWKDEL